MTDRIEARRAAGGAWLRRSLRTRRAGHRRRRGGVLERLSAIVHDLAPKNRALLDKRDALQAKIDAWHRDNGAPSDLDAYKAFLQRDRLSLPEGRPSRSRPRMSIPRSPTIAGPQLVVPVMNARYALNAANARWGSLYDALYGTDAIPETDGAEKGKGYNPKRGAKVIAWARDFLDEAAPLDGAELERRSRALRSTDADAARCTTPAARRSACATPAQFAGYPATPAAPAAVLLENNGLHLEIADRPQHHDRQGRSGRHRRHRGWNRR